MMFKFIIGIVCACLSVVSFNLNAAIISEVWTAEVMSESISSFSSTNVTKSSSIYAWRNDLLDCHI